MNNISLIADDIREQIYEVHCLMKCFYSVFETNAIRKNNCYFLVPLAKITFKQYNKLSENFDRLDSALCEKALGIKENEK